MALYKPQNDIDPIETQEWLDAIESVAKNDGLERARFLLQTLANQVRLEPGLPVGGVTPYINTLSSEDEAKLPDDGQMAAKIEALTRWNAIAIVLRGGKRASELGGHIATYASAATLIEVGFNHFFRARDKEFLGDMVYFQGHASPGIYARSFLEGRIDEAQLDNFRQEVYGKGLSSYPHPWLMPDYWQFPTVSMGLGPIQSIYQARFLRYLENRGLVPRQGRKVWTFCGDGEMDEPESVGALTIAVREKLDNLIFVVNCNLQRLDGPVRGNGKIIQELEGVFAGAGWHVIKVVWGSNWDPLLAEDTDGLLRQRMMECLDGEYQSYVVHDGAYIRTHFFGKYPELLEMVEGMSDEEIWNLTRGGHDIQKVYAAYAAASSHEGGPVVILTKTTKGYGMGSAGEAQNTTHQQKKMPTDALEVFCERFNVPIPKDQIAQIPYYKPAPDSPEMQYLQERRRALGGYLPARQDDVPALKIPALNTLSALLESSGDREISTTMVFVRILSLLLRDKEIGKNIVPIVPDECRTFGMEGLFRQIGIYSPNGQLYDPVDKNQVMFYLEKQDGQLLEEGLNEAGAICSWIAAATSYANNALTLIPFFIYYSMFGFQRVGDLAWAAGDSRARGFLLGATAGRTTLAGEGLQHTDGHSHVFSNVIPNCLSYDPAFSYELAVIIHYGLERMYVKQDDVFFYITVMNENYFHPSMPVGAEEGIIKGMYLFQSSDKKQKVQLLGSGAILCEVMKAAVLLEEFNVGADIWSVTSFTELGREGLAVERENNMHPERENKTAFVTQCLENASGPVIAATDYIRVHADQIRQFVPQPYYILGTDGFGRSDTRENLRHHFEVDAKHIAYIALKALVDLGEWSVDNLLKAADKLGINRDKENPFEM